jgi:ribose transport system permease protein
MSETPTITPGTEDGLLVDDSRPESQLAPRQVLRRVGASQTLWISLVLAVIIIIFLALHPSTFGTAQNVRNVTTDAAILLVLAVGMTFVLAAAGIDLSIGSVLVFSSVVAAKVMGSIGNGFGSIILGLVAALLSGLAWGVLNGLLVTKLRVPALIVTLGTLGMALGAALIITDGIDIATVPPSLVSDFGLGKLFGVIPWLDVIGLVVLALGAVVLRATVFGRHVLAIGSREEAARRSGVPVDRRLIEVYALMGLLSGLAGYLSLAQFSTTSVAGYSTENLAAIAAVVIGGTSLFGGMATMFGTLVGVFIPAVLQNGFVISSVRPFWQQVAVGIILIVAVAIDQRGRQTRRGGG